MTQRVFSSRVSFQDVFLPWLRVALGCWSPNRAMKQNLRQKIVDNICREIEAAGFRTQDEFAHTIGMERTSLRRVLSGKYDTRLSTLEKIAEGLEIPLDRLLKPEDSTVKAQLLHTRGKRGVPKQVVLQILVPQGAEIPQWLLDACREGAGHIEPETAPKKAVKGKQLRKAGKDEIFLGKKSEARGAQGSKS